MGAHETCGVSAGKMQLEIQKEIIADIFPVSLYIFLRNVR